MMNINLIGMRGVGKSNVARRLSVLTKRAVMSTDTLIEYETGMPIPAFLASNDGDWRTFRDLEFEVVQKVGRLDDLIVDCGGGMVVDLGPDGEEVFSERKIRALRAAGPVIWLEGDIARLAAKTAGDVSRPSLHAVRSAEEIMRRREPLYRSASERSYFVNRGERQQVAEEIAVDYGLLPSLGGMPGPG